MIRIAVGEAIFQLVRPIGWVRMAVWPSGTDRPVGTASIGSFTLRLLDSLPVLL
jgi:hypothetical protein